LCNVLLPGLVKRDFPHRLGLMGGLYTTAICASAALGAGFTYPLYAATGEWNLALWFWALPAAVVLFLFLPVAVRQRPARHQVAKDGVNVWRSAVAWQVTIFMVLQAMMSFSVFAWLAPILRERGVDGATAGLIVSVSIVLQMLGSLFAPALAARFPDQRAINVMVALMTGGGFALSIFGPLELVWVWAGLLGLGQGSLTAVALTMIMLRTRDGHTAAHLSGMMQGVGYGLGSTGTLMVGQLHQAAGSFSPAGVLFLAVGLLAAVFGYRAGKNRFVEDPTGNLVREVLALRLRNGEDERCADHQQEHGVHVEQVRQVEGGAQPLLQVRGGAAEQCHADGVRDAHANGADAGGEKLRVDSRDNGGARGDEDQHHGHADGELPR
jgi:CP family cyanate transporter-like MFS transporter